MKDGEVEEKGPNSKAKSPSKGVCLLLPVNRCWRKTKKKKSFQTVETGGKKQLGGKKKNVRAFFLKKTLPCQAGGRAIGGYWHVMVAGKDRAALGGEADLQSLKKEKGHCIGGACKPGNHKGFGRPRKNNTGKGEKKGVR